MKYIITENRLHEFMNNYLNSWASTKVINDRDGFIFMEEPSYPGADEWNIVMEFDYREDGRLWFNNNFRKNFMDIFMLTSEEANQFIKEWFENKFDVEVKYIQ